MSPSGRTQLLHAVSLRSEAVSSVPYLLRIRTWSPHPIHRTSSASPPSLSLLKLLAAFSITRSFGRYRASQPAARVGPWSVGRSVDVGRLDLRGRMAAFPAAQAQLGRGAVRPLPPSLFMDAFYLHRFPTILTSFLPCPALSCRPSLLPQFSRIDHTAGRTRTHKWSCSFPLNPPNSHCTALPRHVVPMKSS